MSETLLRKKMLMQTNCQYIFHDSFCKTRLSYTYSGEKFVIDCVCFSPS